MKKSKRNTLSFLSSDNFKEFGTNCDSMAAEIEDYILLNLHVVLKYVTNLGWFQFAVCLQSCHLLSWL